MHIYKKGRWGLRSQLIAQEWPDLLWMRHKWVYSNKDFILGGILNILVYKIYIPALFQLGGVGPLTHRCCAYGQCRSSLPKFEKWHGAELIWINSRIDSVLYKKYRESKFNNVYIKTVEWSRVLWFDDPFQFILVSTRGQKWWLKVYCNKENIDAHFATWFDVNSRVAKCLSEAQTTSSRDSRL